MTAFASAEDLATLLQQSFTAEETATADLLLDIASTAIRNEVGQTVDVVADESITVDGPDGAVLILPELPVTAVAAVEIDGTALVDGTDFRWSAAGVLRRLSTEIVTADRTVCSQSWGGRPRSVSMTYSHGWVPTSREYQAARKVALQAAARLFVNPQQAGAESIGDWSRSWGSSGNAASGVTLTQFERRELDRLRSGSRP